MARYQSRKKSAAGPSLLIWLPVFGLLIGAMVFLLAYRRAAQNPWQVRLTLQGPREIVLECGESYADPGATAQLISERPVGGTQTWELPVTVSGEWDTKVPGTYFITYVAKTDTRERGLFSGLRHAVHASETRSVIFRDTTAPELVLEGEPELTLKDGETYREAGFRAVDLVDGDLSDQVVRTEKNGLLTYTVTDRAGNTATASRKLHREDAKPPVITLKGENEIRLPWGSSYTEEGFTAEDAVDGDITDLVVREEQAERILYRVSDAAGNTAEAVRLLSFYDDQPPVLTLQGQAYYRIDLGQSFTPPGCTATDNKDGDLTGRVRVRGSFSAMMPGKQTLVYSCTDEAGNSAEVTCTIEVIGSTGDTTLPKEVWPAQKTIYLTFDDGPGDNTLRVLDILRKYNIKATFFVCNTKQRAYIKNIAEEGHALGIHCATHNYAAIYASDEAYFRDFNSIREVIHQYSGQWVRILRFPGGSSNESSKQYSQGLMTRLTKSVEAMGYKYFDWNASAGDSGGGATTQMVYDRVTQAAQQKGTLVVLMHENYTNTVNALESIIEWGFANGYAFSALDLTSPGMHQQIMN